MSITFTNEMNGNEGKILLFENDLPAGEIFYTLEEPLRLILHHTEVGEAFQGKGYAKQLVMQAVEMAREKKLKITPYCPYAQSVFRRDASLAEMLFK